jgi:DNA-binding SARP family transcriptional activator
MDRRHTGQAATNPADHERLVVPHVSASCARTKSRAPSRPTSAEAPREDHGDGVATATGIRESLPGGGLPLVRLFGPLRIERPHPAAPGLRAARGLIAYLALHRCPAGFEELLETLWPGQDPKQTRPRLWKAKRHASRVLVGALERRGASYVLDPSRFRLDVSEVERLSGRGRGLAELERAASLSAGTPLADVDYTFADGHRRRLQSIRADLLTHLARARLASGHVGAALAAAEELIGADRFNEQGWRLAMEAEAALGSRQAIIDRYQRLRQVLDTELGLAPQADTRATYHRLLGQA